MYSIVNKQTVTKQTNINHFAEQKTSNAYAGQRKIFRVKNEYNMTAAAKDWKQKKSIAILVPSTRRTLQQATCHNSIVIYDA